MSFKVHLRSPSKHHSAKEIDCPKEWSVKELKQYISTIYEECPTIENQRIIYSGRILTNTEKIDDIFKNRVESKHIIHVVFNVKTKESPETKYEPLQPNEIEQLKKEYYAYLQDFYQQNTVSESDNQRYLQAYAQYIQACFGAHSSGAPTLDQQPVAAAAPNFLLQPFHALGQGLRRLFVRPLPQQANENDIIVAVEEQGGGLAQMDFIDVAFTIFRLSMLAMILLAYSSVEKALLVVTCISAFFLYRMYGDYQRNNREAGPQQQRPEQPQQQQQQQQETSNQPGSVDPGATETAPPQDVQLTPPPAPAAGSLTLIRNFIFAVFHFCYTLAISLIPEHIPINDN